MFDLLNEFRREETDEAEVDLLVGVGFVAFGSMVSSFCSYMAARFETVETGLGLLLAEFVVCWDQAFFF